MTFKEWFDGREWWHDSTAYHGLHTVWAKLAGFNIPAEQIGQILDEVCDVMRNEYGD